ncbi:hypothetical protein [Nesterenkonia xinjiangensis]|uniref:Putative membrane protein YkoI n=1 Tax=Nesterenkonia xinjiangensis TaxID=225327 RepID=A0A7Z0GNA9_9MICC|nr:hypothetical protein [Nesterenkonia xinjiangensis]NYJ79172.1 putative membrane protein YkoI [Nesterenkonia xinjiangensis]
MQKNTHDDHERSPQAPSEHVPSKEHTMTPASRTLSPATITGLSVAALAALALTACGPDDTLDTSGDGEPNSTVTIGTEDEDAADDAQGEADETDPAEDADATAEEDPAEEDEPSASGEDHPLYGGLETVQAEYPDGVVFEVESDDDRYEWHISVDGIERELHTEKASGEIVHTEDDDAPDSDDLREIDAIEIDIAEAFQTAEEHAGDPAGAFVDEAQLDTEGGDVVWDIELDNGREIAVDVTSAEVIHIDD